jgi:SHS2 domain-containing protein
MTSPRRPIVIEDDLPLGAAADAHQFAESVTGKEREASMYRWIDHTAELELEVRAESEADVLGEAFTAMGELLAEGEREGEGYGPTISRRVVIEAVTRPVLLAEWLSELAFFAETEGLVPERIAELTLEAERLEAMVEGRRGQPRHFVKAVTYHRLAFEANGDGWRATAVLDV